MWELWVLLIIVPMFFGLFSCCKSERKSYSQHRNESLCPKACVVVKVFSLLGTKAQGKG